MDPITIDGLNEDDFRCSIESMLRDGEADAAAAKLRALIEPYAGDTKTLPARLLSISPADFTFNGWDELGNRLGKYDRPGHWVSAIGVSVVDPREAEGFADASARLSPCIETAFYSDDAYPFSKSDRGDLLEGYTRQGAEWQGNFEQADMTLTVSGVEDLYEAVAQLEARLFASDAPDDEEIRAGSLCACYLSVLLHQAVRDKIRSVGLPRPLCVMTGCVGVYPFFDAPVMSSIECIDGGFLGMEELLPVRKESRQAKASEEPDTADAGDAFGSLLSLTPRIARKKMVMELDAEESAAATREFEMASAHQLAEAGDAAPKAPGPDFAAYAFDSLPEGALAPEDDDWADIPDGPPSAESQFDRQMDDWFGDLDKPGMPTHAAEEAEQAEAFPSADVAGWNLDEPAARNPVHGSGQIEDLSFDHEADSADMAQGDGYSADEAFHTPHPDDSCYAPPEQPVGHGLRARLAHSLQVETPKRSGPFEPLYRVIAWIRNTLS